MKDDSVRSDPSDHVEITVLVPGSDEKLHALPLSLEIPSATATTVSTPPDSSLPPAVPPILLVPLDGGLRAWFQVLGAFCLFFNLWGYTFAYGSFQSYYLTHYLTGTSASSIAWIGSIQSFLLIISGVISGPLFDMGYFKTLMYTGAALSSFGSLMLSFSSSYWQIFLSQGICIGLGCGILFVPSMSLVTRSFVKRRALAVGMMSCGAPVGSILYTFIFEGLLPRVGFSWTARSMFFFMLGIYVISFPLLLWRTTNTGRLGDPISNNGNNKDNGDLPASTGTPTPTPSPKRKLFDKAALKDLLFWSYALAVSTQFMAYLIPYFYMPTYATTQLNTSTSLASYVLAISQAASVPGRILAAIAANKLGVMIPWTICALVSGLMCLIWSTVHTLPGFITFCAIYGCFSGALVPLPPSVFPRVVVDPRVLGTRLGMAQGISSVANMIGPPIAGALLRVGVHGGDSAKNQKSQNWLAVQLFSGLVLLFATLQIGGLWFLLVRKRGTPVLV